MVRVIHDVAGMQEIAERLRLEGKRIGVVPTMGYLHEGHLSLIRLATQHADSVTTTVFVNPTQFAPGEDFDRYPRGLERDVDLARSAGTEYVFAPETSSMYPLGYRTYVEVEGLSSLLEGESRPGHFRGVATVVTKLFHLVKPHVAVFGQKDVQQVAVIRRMIKDLNFEVEVLLGATVREPDGLAMSSRNMYLSPEQRKQAPVLFRSLELAGQRVREGIRSSSAIMREMKEMIAGHSTGAVDYVSIADTETFEEVSVIETQRPIVVSLAVRFGATRLIDNRMITPG